MIDALNGHPTMPGITGVPHVYKLSQIVSHSDTFVFLDESDSSDYNVGSWVVYGTGDQWWDPVASWHLVKAVFSYSDGHVRPYRWRDPRSVDICENQKFGEVTPGNPDLEFLQKGFNPNE